ncbi:hypothetical protein [Sphingopyxis witflariensis]|uniref:hypothetical protein n=1 Tax=Sphingopyxis witflariensis TaxID=173675 RepID=UPI001181A313|nr:hypothetical protein [Sphingopyxis witflariensis]
MNGRLPASRPAANWRVMRFRPIQFMLLIVALLACPDTPAIAYDAVSPGIDVQHRASVDASEDASPDDKSPNGTGSELVHHHHCPAGLVADESPVPGSCLPARDTHLSRTAAALSSRATAPPIEPPAA